MVCIHLMSKFGQYKPSRFIEFILNLVRIGLGRGKFKKILSRIIKKYHNSKYLDLNYNGLKLRICPSGNTIESKILSSSKIREEIELNELKKAVRDKGVFIDVGANVGYYSLFAAKFGAEKIISFEPNPVLCERFKTNIDLNEFEERVNIFKFALGEKKGSAKLHLSDSDLGGSSLLQCNHATNSISVNVISLVEILDAQGIKKIDALKIDVEGFEDRVMKPFFEKSNEKLYPKIVIIEDSSKEQWGWDVISWMHENGYQTVNRTRGNLILKFVKQ